MHCHEVSSPSWLVKYEHRISVNPVPSVSDTEKREISKLATSWLLKNIISQYASSSKLEEEKRNVWCTVLGSLPVLAFEQAPACD